MKLKHIIVIAIFILLAIVSAMYLKTKEHSKNVSLDDIYPKKVVEKYYSDLKNRDGRNIINGMLPYEKYKRWYLYDDQNRPDARLTAHMMRNMKFIHVNSIKEKKYTGAPIEFPKRNSEMEKFPLDRTVLYEINYNIGYYNVGDKSIMYSEYNNLDYDSSNPEKTFKNKREKIWLVKLKNGAWKIAQISQLK